MRIELGHAISRQPPSDRILLVPSLIPSFLDDRESLFERAILHDDFAEPFHEGPQSRFGHSRDQFVEHAALAEERMGAMLGGVGLEMAVHAETFSGGAEQRQENDREGVEEKQPVAPLGVRIRRTPIPMPKRRSFVSRNPGSIVQRLA